MRKISNTTLITLFIGALTLTGCGQRGPLTLPEPANDNESTSFERNSSNTGAQKEAE